MEVKNIRDLAFKKWSGGITKELYRDREDFFIRISCAEIDPGESLFSDFTGYERILKILENSVCLTREEEEIVLDSKEIFFFDGAEKIKSKNEKKVLDFNIIHREGALEYFEETEGKKNIHFKNKAIVFSKGDGNSLERSCEIIRMDRYDFIIFMSGDSIDLYGNFLIVTFR